MSAKHTPGPWKAIPNPMRSDGWFVVRDVPPQPYPGVSSPDGGPLMQLPPGIVCHQVPEGDARLIAAAPDLLFHLKLLATAADNPTENRSCLRARVAVAALAVARAEGDTSFAEQLAEWEARDADRTSLPSRPTTRVNPTDGASVLPADRPGRPVDAVAQSDLEEELHATLAGIGCELMEDVGGAPGPFWRNTRAEEAERELRESEARHAADSETWTNERYELREAIATTREALHLLIHMLRAEMTGSVHEGLRNLNCNALVDLTVRLGSLLGEPAPTPPAPDAHLEAAHEERVSGDE